MALSQVEPGDPLHAGHAFFDSEVNNSFQTVAKRFNTAKKLQTPLYKIVGNKKMIQNL